MTTDVGTTTRQKLSPTERLKLFEREGGRCCICGQKIVGAFIVEHKRALGVGGGNELANLGVAHIKCADVKTHDEDMPRIVKAKAQKRSQHAIKPESTRPIESRNTLSSGKPKKEHTDPFPGLPAPGLSRRFR